MKIRPILSKVKRVVTLQKFRKPKPVHRGPDLSINKIQAETGKKYRVALCFSGQIRNLDKGYEYIYKNVIQPNLEDCQLDVFMHIFFEQADIGKTFIAANGTHINAAVKPTAVSDIYKYYNPQKVLFEKPIDFDEKDYREHKPEVIVPLYSLRKNYSLKRAMELKAEHEVQNGFIYDYVMTLRTDLGINNPIVFKEFNPDIVSNSEYGVHEGYGIDPTHAVMGGKLADAYGTFFDHMDQYYREGIRFCDEPMFHRHLELRNIPFHRTPRMNDYTLLRNE